MARFLHDLNREIQDVVELQHCGTLGELVHQAIKVEMQIRRRSASRRPYVGSSGWKGKEKEKEKVRREKSPKKGSEPSQGRKELAITPTPNAPRTSNIRCFKCLSKGHITSQCPNRRAMILRDNGEVECKSSRDEHSSSTKIESHSDGSHCEEDVLMMRRLVNSQIGKETGTQRENVFHSRSLVFGNLCSMIINGGSCVNVASQRLMKKLDLPTFAHPRPYKLQCLSEKEEELQQVEVAFTLSSYEDRVVCDVVLMEATHLLLGRLVTNRFTFVHMGQRIGPKHLSPK
ncbi:hypothetical protein CR513_43177, partial [Mucuna pruriens]